MALSYSNIEACLVKSALEKAEETDDVSLDVASKKRPGPLQLIQLVLNIVSFAAVIWLVVQVLHLQKELVQLDTIKFRQSSMNQTKPSDSDKGSRMRRQTGQDDSMSSSSSYGDCDNTCDGLPSFHVTGIEQPQLDSGNWFTFHTHRDDAFSRFSHENLRFVHSKFFEVTQPGYYFVYSQISYRVRGSYTYGHEVVVSPDCGNGDSFAILREKSTQRTTDDFSVGSDNTGYTGGVFYLAANDRLGVRPLHSQSILLDYQDSIAQTSYFGAFLLAPDINEQVDTGLSQCT